MGVEVMNGRQWPEDFEDGASSRRLADLYEQVKGWAGKLTGLIRGGTEEPLGIEVMNGRVWTGDDLVHPGEPASAPAPKPMEVE